MPTIAEYKPDYEVVPLKNKQGDFSFRVRGLGFEDVASLVNLHLSDVEAGYALFERARTSIVSDAGYEALAMTLVRGAPGLVAEVISYAADDSDNAAHYSTVPFSVTVLALEKVLRLTLQDVGGLKNLVAMVDQVKRDHLPQSAVEEPPSPESGQSQTSSGTSERT